MTSPRIAVDIIIDMGAGMIPLVKRKNPPEGWAIPGGFLDANESLEEAALREAREETNLDIEIIRQFHAYSDPNRDDRGHCVSVVFLARAKGEPKAGDDAAEVKLYHEMSLPDNIAFDHKMILDDYFKSRY